MFNPLLLAAYTGRLWHLPGVYVAAGQRPSQQFQFDANLLGINSSAYLSSLKIFHRSFRMDKVSKLTLIEPIVSHLRKEVYTPGLAQIIFAFFNYALSRLAIPPSISSWCFNNWKMVERSIVGALLVQKWLARDQFLRSTNGKLCNLFNCLLPLVQTIVFEFCRTSTEILGPNWKSSCLDVCGTLASHAYLLFGTGMSESKSVAIFNYLVNIFDMANHACFICRTSSRGSVSARQPYAWIMYNDSWEFKPRTARRGSEQPWTRIRQSGDIHSLRIMGAKLHGGVGQCLLQVLNHGQRWLGCIGKQRDGKSWKTMVGRLYKKAHGRPGLNWKTTCAIELFLVAWDPGSRTCRVFKSHERGIFLYCNATK